MARAIAFAIEQPKDVNIKDIVLAADGVSLVITAALKQRRKGE